MEILDLIKQTYSAFIVDAEVQSEKGNKAAGARARKAALELSKQFKEFRKVSLESSKS